MALIGPRVCLQTDTLAFPVLTDVARMDLAGDVLSARRITTRFSPQGDSVSSCSVSFDANGYALLRTEVLPSGQTRSLSFRNSYRHGRLQRVETLGDADQCSVLSFRYDLAGNVIGHATACNNDHTLLSTRVFDRFRNPLSEVDHAQGLERTTLYRYDPLHPGQILSSTSTLRAAGRPPIVLTSTYVYTTQGAVAQVVTTGSDGSREVVRCLYDEASRLLLRETERDGHRTVETFQRDAAGSCLARTLSVDGQLSLREETEVSYASGVAMR